MTDQTNYAWERIEDLPDNLNSLTSQQVSSVMKAWLEKAKSLKESGSYTRFLIELRREWAIETGVLERLYTIDEGATKTLIEKGFDAALLSHEDTDIPLPQVLDMIQDHHTALEGLLQFVSDVRQLSKSYIRELHQVLTAHQQTYEARDSLGNYVNPPMVRGDWKRQPNNIEGPNGFNFEFCPPEQVDIEVERLLHMHVEHEQGSIPPEVEAAWLHHRFTLIHPFVDGNGRVARCLATLVFLKVNWFPLVITRHDKPDYIQALRQADQGDLSALVTFFGDLQRKAARRAFSLSEEVGGETVAIQTILSSVSQKFTKRREEQRRQYDGAVTISEALFTLVFQRLTEVSKDVKSVVKRENPDFSAFVLEAARDDEKSNYYRFQIAQAAKQLNYFANLRLYPAWITLHVDAGVHTTILFSFHGIGHEWSGILACSAVAYRTQPSDDGRNEATDIRALCTEPFEITYADGSKEIEQRFRKWVEDCVVSGLQYWQELV